jgi:hypothetical protein
LRGTKENPKNQNVWLTQAKGRENTRRKELRIQKLNKDSEKIKGDSTIKNKNLQQKASKAF